MLDTLKELFSTRRTTRKTHRDRLFLEGEPSAIYAIGDIHGCLTELLALEDAIYRDAARLNGEKWIIYLGDYIDRGPDSAGVLDHVMTPARDGFLRICLAGNHEEAFLRFVDSRCRDERWLSWGGVETLASYGLDFEEDSEVLSLKLMTHIPATHIEFLRGLPELVRTRSHCFVHAGIDPSRSWEEQDSKVLLWSRPQRFDWENAALDFTVVHGHTPVDEPQLDSNRINVDIGAYSNRVLAAAKIIPDGGVRFLYSR